ncbi:MmgE/PrpD family protein [Peristeroidobacter agariperforans]|uniref:MmgE/PrpD family protein n=1 Tax=Peristeroidobacter agariperforans TaxID=268404 RepID=UPI00101BE931|nr:MmgE/PrpD family protein [Peristeroidobacter agariperforans]
MNSSKLSETERLAERLLQPIDGSVRRRARLHLLDWLGCVAGARTSAVGKIQRNAQSGAPVQAAAWLGNVLEMDDVHRAALLHPGPVIWPTVLDVGGDALDSVLEAAIRGYEAMIAVGSMFDARHYSFWHNTSTAGFFGASAAAACLLGADRDQLVSALGLAGSVAGGLWQMRHEPVMAKQWHLAHAMATGVAAARQARNGVTGPRFILEGPQGLLAATCLQPKPLDLGGAWKIEAVSFKPWGACRHAHPAIDAAMELKSRGLLTGRITVSTYRDALVFCNRLNPASVLEAKFSLQHAVAIVMKRGRPRLSDFEPAAIEELAELRKLVTVEESPEMTAAYPAHFGARVTSDSGEVTLSDTLGDPERPLSEAGVVTKVRELMEWGGLASSSIDDIVRTVFEAHSVRDITAVVRGLV